MRKLELPILCDCWVCEERGDRPRCYLDSEPGTYKRCNKYLFWKAFEERHDRITREA